MNRKLLTLITSILIILAVCSGISSSASTNATFASDKATRNTLQRPDASVQEIDAEIDNWIKTHSMQEKVAQMFIVTPEALSGSQTAVTDSGITAARHCRLSRRRDLSFLKRT